MASYDWSFGDGSTGSGATPTHAYSTAGTYTATLTVTDSRGASASASRSLTVVSVPSPFIAVVSRHPTAGVRVSFSGARSSDHGSSLTAYRWSFGDGRSGSGRSPGHTYRRPGVYTVALTVRDAWGTTVTVTRRLAVRAASITRVRVSRHNAVSRLKVTLSGPGTLRLGTTALRVGRPRTVSLRLALSLAQRQRLLLRHLVTLRLALKFTPEAGAVTRLTVKVKLRR
ncbi:MAG: PKD domain-containing protein [Actinomycetota bacterium]|nr:PKD domain-containing protein [Actinomycetota bacterium]